MKLSEKSSLKKTLITAIPSSYEEDFSILLDKIKKLKSKAFHCVYLAMPSKYLTVFKKHLLNSELKVRQFEVKNGIAKMEIT